MTTLEPPAPIRDIQDASELFKDQGFPGTGYVIKVEENKYASQNFSQFEYKDKNGLAFFATELDAKSYIEYANVKNSLTAISGEPMKISFDDAIALAKSKPVLDAVCLMEGLSIKDIVWVR